MKNYMCLIFTSLLFFIFSNGVCFSQEQHFYSAADEIGFFCSFEPSESGDNPDVISVTNSKGFFYLHGSLSSEEWDLVTKMVIDTPIKFDIDVISTYNESGEGFETYVLITKIAITGDPQPGSCKGPQ
jgi:hypothetical protein